MKTDYQKVWELFRELGIITTESFETPEFGRKYIIVTESDTEKVVGYMCFYSRWEFDAKGSFLQVGFYE